MAGSSSRPRWKSGSAAASTTSPTPSPASACAPAGSARLVDNPVGRIILNHARAVGMDMSDVVMAQVRRRRQGRPHRPELHRGRHRRPRPASPCTTAATPPPCNMKPGDDRLQEALQGGRRPLAAHRRHLHRPLRRHAPPSCTKPSRPPTKPARSSPTTSTSAPSSGPARRPARPPSDAGAVHRLPDRQRGGLPEGAGLRGRRRRTRTSRALDTSAYKTMVEKVVEGLPQHQGRRHDAPRGEERPDQQLVGHPLARRQVLREPRLQGPGDRRPRRRRRRLRHRLRLRLPHRQDTRRNASTSAPPTARSCRPPAATPA